MQFRNYVIGALFLTVLLFCGCGAKDTAVSGPAEAVTGSTEAEESGSAGTMISGPQAAVSGALNSYDTLSVPTCIRKIGDTWFIADCYHNQVIYSDDLSAPLSDWHVLTGDAVQPHTIAGDGTVYLVDDTEQNRVLIFVKKGGRFYHTQTFDDIGNRPHYSVYDPGTDTFYVLSSMTGQMYLFRHAQGDTQMKLTAVHTIAGMEKSYIRSFMVEGGDIYFVSGIPLDGSRPCIRPPFRFYADQRIRRAGFHCRHGRTYEVRRRLVYYRIDRPCRFAGRGNHHPDKGSEPALFRQV